MQVPSLCQSRRKGEGKLVCDDVVGSLFAPLVAAEGMVPEDIMKMVAAGARNVLWVDGQSEFAAETEKEGQWCETMLDGATRHGNQGIRCGGGEDAWQEMEMFAGVCVGVVEQFTVHDGGSVFLKSAAGTVG